MTQVRIDALGTRRYELGESPVWDVDTDRLYWTDGLRGDVHRAAPDGAIEQSWRFPEPVGSFCLTAEGTILAACATGLTELDPASGEFVRRHDMDPGADATRLNDGKVAPDGSFVFGSMDRAEEQPLGAAYRYTTACGVERLTDGFVVFNGPAWSPDGTTFYASDSGAGRLLRFERDAEGRLGPATLVASTDRPLEGSFDGATVDDQGCLWSARIFGGRLTRFTPEGAIDREITLPVRKPTSVCFGGADLSVLFVTSMGGQLSPRFPVDGPLGGAVFAVHGLGVRGLPMRRFGR